MKFIVLYFFRVEAHTSFYQEARKIYNNQPLAGISSNLSLFSPAAAPRPGLTPTGNRDPRRNHDMRALVPHAMRHGYGSNSTPC